MPDNHKRRLLALNVGLFLYALYLLSYRGGFHSVDEVSMFAVTESLVKFGRFNTDQIAWTQWTTTQAEAQGFFGQDGHVYSKKGLALSLAQAPLYGLALYLPKLGMLQTVSLLNAFITALTGLLVLMFVWRLGFSSLTAVGVALIYGMATIAFVYAKYLFSEPLAGFLLLLAAYMLFTYRQEVGLHHVFSAGLAAGLSVLARANNLFLLPVFGLYLLWVEGKRLKSTRPEVGPSPQLEINSLDREPNLNTKRETGKMQPSVALFNRTTFTTLATFLLALAIPGVMLLAYNAIRSGSPLETGYDLTLFSSNPWLGLYKLLFSPLRGLFSYSPILLLSLPGWWHFRRCYPAEAWLFVGLIGLTLSLFSFWTSGEGLSWGSRFLVPLVPFFVIFLAPLLQSSSPDPKGFWKPLGSLHNTHYTLRITFFVLLAFSLLIQLLGVIINPWVYLAQLQTELGGEFFLENTAALYDFRYSQIVGQWLAWSLENVDLAWLRWGFDGVAFGLSAGLVLWTGWLLRRNLRAEMRITPPPPHSSYLLYLTLPLTLVVTYLLLARYNHTDRQFGSPDDAYTRALYIATAQSGPADPIFTVAQYHYHVPLNRFKATRPLIGFAQQGWPPPDTALPLLAQAPPEANVWLVTIGFPPAAPDNATEHWLTLNHFKVSETWLADSVRLVRYTTRQPTTTRPIAAILGQQEIELVAVTLAETAKPGQTLPVEFTWLPLQAPKTDYNLFLQLLNIEGGLVAQHDNPLNGGYTSTTLWSPHKPEITRHALALPAALLSGDYRLIAGLYDSTTGERVPVNGQGDFVELGNIIIVEGGGQ